MHSDATQQDAAQETADSAAETNGVYAQQDLDPVETTEWVESFQGVVQSSGPDRARFLLDRLQTEGKRTGAAPPFTPTTPYLNTIPVEQEPEYPGDRELERRIKGINRWNAAALVIRGLRKS